MRCKIRSICLPVKCLRHFLVSFHVHQYIQTLPWSVCVQYLGMTSGKRHNLIQSPQHLLSISLSFISETTSSFSTRVRWRIVSPAQIQSLLQSSRWPSQLLPIWNTQSHLTFAGRRQVQTNTSVCVLVHHGKVFCILLSSKRVLVCENLCHLTCSAAWVFITMSREPGCLKGTLFITMTSFPPPPQLHTSFHRFSFSRHPATGTYSPGLYRDRLTRKLAHLLPLPSREKMCQLMNEELKKTLNENKTPCRWACVNCYFTCCTWPD